MKQILTFWNEAQTHSYSDTITNYLPVLPVVLPLTIDTLSFIEDSITRWVVWNMEYILSQNSVTYGDYGPCLTHNTAIREFWGETSPTETVL